MPVAVEFTYGDRMGYAAKADGVHSGGLEMLFSNQRKHDIALPAKDETGEPASIAFLVRYLCNNTMKDHRKELFVLDDTV